MKKLILLSLCSFNIFAQSFSHDAILDAKKYQQLVIKQCKKEMVGCVPTVRVDRENINLDSSSLDPKFYAGLEKLKETGVTMGMTLNSYGVVVKEKGHMPNPMVEQKIFKYVYKNNAVLKICQMDESIGVVGCADSITIKTDESDIEARADYSKVEIDKEAYLNKKAFVIGYFKFEDGHMPNPMVSQHVFKVVKVSFSGDSGTEASNNISRGTIIKNLFERNNSDQSSSQNSSKANQR